MARYAADTPVPVEKTRVEIEAVLKRYGATAFGYAWTDTAATIMFDVTGRRVRIVLPIPDPKERRFHETKVNASTFYVREATKAQAQARWEQACRQAWRALLLVIKAKLEAVEAHISTVEREFLADIVLPNGATVGEWTQPQIAAAYANNEMPALLPGTGNSHG